MLRKNVIVLAIRQEVKDVSSSAQRTLLFKILKN